MGFALWLLVTGGIVSVFEKPFRAFEDALPKNPILTFVIGVLEVIIVLGWIGIGFGLGDYVAEHFATAAAWVVVIAIVGFVLFWVGAFVWIVIGALRAPRLRPRRDPTEGGGLSDG